MLLFYDEDSLNDVDKYITNLLNDFKANYNSTTLNLLLERDSFDLNINDTLFDEYFNKIQNMTNYKKSANSNYQRLFAVNYLKENGSKTDFKFSLMFFKKVIIITNEDNFTKLILNLLNVLLLWY